MHGQCLSIDEDFPLCDEKIGEYYTGVRRVLTKVWGKRQVAAYMTSTKKSGGPDDCFSVLFFRSRCRFCAHTRKILNETKQKRFYGIHSVIDIFLPMEHRSKLL